MAELLQMVDKLSAHYIPEMVRLPKGIVGSNRLTQEQNRIVFGELLTKTPNSYSELVASREKEITQVLKWRRDNLIEALSSYLSNHK